ncbi:RHS domain-containing protein [Streptococcus timonensis]|uniref:RHS domain-containing protein n=1 Tax=Streptococcus timonensis TaxID=1852387 RepID=UPI0039C47ACC
MRYVCGFAYQNQINEDGENRQQTHYFHCDQIGIPKEMTAIHVKLLWYGEYTAWDRLK